FLASVCRDWEAAATPAVEAGIRVLHLRFGVVLSAAGGALAKMLGPVRMGMGGPIGSGRQSVSWLALDDGLGALSQLRSTRPLHPRTEVATQRGSPTESARYVMKQDTMAQTRLAPRSPASTCRRAPWEDRAQLSLDLGVHRAVSTYGGTTMPSRNILDPIPHPPKT